MKPITNPAELVAARASLNLTQEALGAVLGLSPSTIKRHERSLSLDPMLALAVECLLRRTAGNRNVPVSPEERARRKFLEKAEFRRLQEEAGWKPRTGPQAQAEARRQAALEKANRTRAIVRGMIADMLSVYEGQTLEQRKGQLLVWSTMADAPDTHPLIRAFIEGMVDGSIVSRDDPRITLPDEV